MLQSALTGSQSVDQAVSKTAAKIKPLLQT
jgi:hypothetical protein